RTQSCLMPQDEWRVVIPNHHPGYITWDQFLANRQRLAANRTNCEVLVGPAREGLCLLQGLLVCGTCGRRLSVRYTGNGGLYPIYQCNWKHRARYDADLAERRYEAVDPANRLIASTLEQRWNDAMRRLLELETELANFE